MTSTVTLPHPVVVRPPIGGPLVCVCHRPQPKLVRLWGKVTVEGAFECRRCRRRWWPP